jgi:hypothetical protein
LPLSTRRLASDPEVICGAAFASIGKLNMKSAGFAAPVEWRQDWVFHPHTNDDLAAVGIMLDDCDEDTGPMLVI